MTPTRQSNDVNAVARLVEAAIQADRDVLLMPGQDAQGRLSGSKAGAIPLRAARFGIESFLFAR